MYSGSSRTENDIILTTIFHCENCSSDWENDHYHIAQVTEFKRKFWG
jgi:hypothetical protein